MKVKIRTDDLRQRRKKKIAVGLTVISLFLLFLCLERWLDSGKTDEIYALRKDDRRVLFVNTLSAVRIACGRAMSSDLRDYCKEQVDFIRRFPECDANCVRELLQYGPQPSR